MSSAGHDLRIGLGIARLELRRSLRKSLGTRRRQLGLLGFIVVFSPLLLFWFGVARDAGRIAAATGRLELEALGVQVTLLVVLFVLLGAMRVVQSGRPDGEELLFIATTPRAVLLGFSIHAAVQVVGFLLVPVLLFAGGFAIGSGYTSIPVMAIITTVPLFTAVSVLGTVLGQLAVLALLESEGLRKASRLFGLIILVALMGMSYAAMAPLAGRPELLDSVAIVARPTLAYLSFVFVGTSLGPAVGAGSVVVGGIVLLSIPTFVAVASRLAPRLWFADSTPSGQLQRDTSVRTVTGVGGDGAGPGRPFPPRSGSTVFSLALGLWVRWIRIPVRFSALFPVAIVVVTGFFGAVNDPTVLPVVGGAVVAFVGVYVSGAIFALNPLGEAGPMQAIEILSRTPGRSLILAHVVAGLLVGLPMTVGGAVIIGFSVGASTVGIVGLVVLAATLSVGSAGVAVGIGTLVPSRDSQRTYRGYTVATPSQMALIGFMLAALLLGAIATAAGAILVLTGRGLSPTTTGLFASGALILLGGIGYMGFVTGTRRFESAVTTAGT